METVCRNVQGVSSNTLYVEHKHKMASVLCYCSVQLLRTSMNQWAGGDWGFHQEAAELLCRLLGIRMHRNMFQCFHATAV